MPNVFACDFCFHTHRVIRIHVRPFCSALSKSKSKEQNFGFGPKQNTKVTLEPPTTTHTPKTFKEVPGKLEA